MAEIIDAELIASIRRLLGVKERTVPDEAVLDPLVGGAAEAEVIAAVGEPAFALRPPAEQLRMRQAVAYLTVATLLGTGAVREQHATTSERFSDQYAVQRNAGAMDRDGWIADLRRRADEALAPLRPTGPAFTGMFTLAAGRRGA